MTDELQHHLITHAVWTQLLSPQEFFLEHLWKKIHHQNKQQGKIPPFPKRAVLHDFGWFTALHCEVGTQKTNSLVTELFYSRILFVTGVLIWQGDFSKSLVTAFHFHPKRQSLERRLVLHLCFLCLPTGHVQNWI